MAVVMITLPLQSWSLVLHESSSARAVLCLRSFLSTDKSILRARLKVCHRKMFSTIWNWNSFIPSFCVCFIWTTGSWGTKLSFWWKLFWLHLARRKRTALATREIYQVIVILRIQNDRIQLFRQAEISPCLPKLLNWTFGHKVQNSTLHSLGDKKASSFSVALRSFLVPNMAFTSLDHWNCSVRALFQQVKLISCAGKFYSGPNVHSDHIGVCFKTELHFDCNMRPDSWNFDPSCGIHKYSLRGVGSHLCHWCWNWYCLLPSLMWFESLLVNARWRTASQWSIVAAYRFRSVPGAV